MHVTGKFVVNLRKIRIQCYWVWGGEGEASCVEPVTAKGVRYRIGAESGEGVRICAGPPWTRPRCLAVRIHRSQVILWAGIGTCIFRNRSTTAESDDIPIRVKILEIAISERWRRNGLSHLLVLGGPLAFVVQEEEQLVFLNRASERCSERVPDEGRSFVRQSSLQLCCLVEEIIRMPEIGPVVRVGTSVKLVRAALGH